MRLKLGRPDISHYAGHFDVPKADDGLAVTFLGVSSLLFDDGQSAFMVDGFFSRPPMHRVLLGRIGPDPARIDAVLDRVGFGKGKRCLDGITAVHSHFDHVMDSAEVAARTGALLLGGRSTVNVGIGAGLPSDRLRPVDPGVPIHVGSYELTFAESTHCPPDRFPGVIDQPLVPPVKTAAYKCGEAWSIHLRHDSGRTALIQGSAGFVPGLLDGWSADVAYLGIGQLGIQPDSYIEDYWRETVLTVGAKRGILTHWDDFFRPLDQPLRALPYAGDDLNNTMRVLARLGDRDNVTLHFPTVWKREFPWFS